MTGSHHLSEKLLSECRIEKMAEKIMSETAKYNISVDLEIHLVLLLKNAKCEVRHPHSYEIHDRLHVMTK